MSKTLITFFNYLLVSNIFTVGFAFTMVNFDFYLNYIFMAGFLIYYFISYRKLHISRNFVYASLAILSLSLINICVGSNTVSLFLKTALGFILNGLVYYLLIRLNDNKVDKLFYIYLRIACIVAVIGILQEISYLIGFKYGYDFSYFIPRNQMAEIQLGMLKVTSILPEPAHFGAAMAPAMFISVLNIMQKKNYFINKIMSFLIIISLLLTFSLIVYVGIFISAILIMLNNRRIKIIIVSAITLVFFAFFSYTYLPGIQRRVNETVDVITGNMPLKLVNLTTYAFYTNGFIAYKSFANNPFFGSGLGSHPRSYDRYIRQLDDPRTGIYGLSRKDAGSLFFRLVSETGLFGVLLFFYFIIRYYVSKSKNENLWMISNSILCLFIMNLLRLGNYFYCGFIFFVWTYYFTSKNAIEEKLPFR